MLLLRSSGSCSMWEPCSFFPYSLLVRAHFRRVLLHLSAAAAQWTRRQLSLLGSVWRRVLLHLGCCVASSVCLCSGSSTELRILRQLCRWFAGDAVAVAAEGAAATEEVAGRKKGSGFSLTTLLLKQQRPSRRLSKRTAATVRGVSSRIR